MCYIEMYRKTFVFKHTHFGIQEEIIRYYPPILLTILHQSIKIILYMVANTS